MEAVRVPAPAVRALPRPEPLPDARENVALRRIDCLLELGAQLACLPEKLDEEESKAGRLPGSFYLTRLPLLVKQMELNLSAIRALGGRPPQVVEQFVADPERFRREGTSLIIAALEGIEAAIAAESLERRPSVRLESAGPGGLV